jgi:hypothetical protein
MRGSIRLFIAVPLLSGCGRVDYDVADLQLDVAGPLPDGAETLHVCVSDVGELEQGAGNGRAAFTGLRAGEAVDVTLDVWDADGNVLASAGPATLDGDTPWASTPLLAPAEPCTAAGGRAPDDAETWLLAVRFVEEL